MKKNEKYLLFGGLALVAYTMYANGSLGGGSGSDTGGSGDGSDTSGDTSGMSGGRNRRFANNRMGRYVG